MEQAKISINIITYNRAQFIAEAIQSVLNQSLVDWELIIVDDGSTDNTKEVVGVYAQKDTRITYLLNDTNLGISKSRARALHASNGKYIAILDSDDVWCDNDKLKKQYDFLEHNEEYILVGGGAKLIDEDGKRIKQIHVTESDFLIRTTLLLKNPFIHSTVMYRRHIAQSVGGYEETFDGIQIDAIEDYQLWLKMGIRGKLANFSESLVAYRVHTGNVSVQRRMRLMRIALMFVNYYNSYYPLFVVALIRRYSRIYIYRMYKFFVK